SLHVEQVQKREAVADLVELFDQCKEGEEAQQGDEHDGAGSIDLFCKIAAGRAHGIRRKARSDEYERLTSSTVCTQYGAPDGRDNALQGVWILWRLRTRFKALQL